MMRLVLPALATVCAVAFQTASAQSIRVIDLVEYRNRITDHYFLTGDPGEIALFDSRAGTGWGRTGTVMQAFTADSTGCSFCALVHRFYRPSNNTHFFTADPGEIAALGAPGSGLRHEGPAFRQNSAGPLEGSCSFFRTQTVYRFYNNRPADPNHRYVASGMRDAMLAKGWVAEGAALCVPSVQQRSLESVGFKLPSATWQSRVLPLDKCKESDQPCFAVGNLGVTQVELGDDLGLTRMKFSAVGRKPSELTYAGPYYPLGVLAFNPYGGHAVETQLLMTYEATVHSRDAGDASSHVYGHPTLEFFDERSGRSLHFSVLTHGPDTTVDFLGHDAASGAVIVGTSNWRSSPYGTGIVYTPTHGVLEPVLGAHLLFNFRMGRSEFLRVLERARQLDPRLSADPASYRLTALRYKNEIAGNGRVDASFGHLGVAIYEDR